MLYVKFDRLCRREYVVKKEKKKNETAMLSFLPLRLYLEKNGRGNTTTRCRHSGGRTEHK